VNALNYCRLVKMTLPKGIPLRLAVRLGSLEDPSFERDPFLDWETPFLRTHPVFEPSLESERFSAGRYLFRMPEEEIFLPSLSLTQSEVDQNQDTERFVYMPAQISRDKRYLFEIPTEGLEAGAFELSIQTGTEELLQFGEEIWILKRENYQKLIDEIISEGFLPSSGLYGDWGVIEYITTLIRKQLASDHFERDGFTRFYLDLYMPENIPETVFPSGPIRWTTEQVVNEFRELALYGVAGAQWTLELTSSRYGLWCHGELTDPLSEAAAESIHDPDSSFLSLLQRSEDFEELTVERGIEPESTSFTLGASHRIDNFEIAD
jgi:hypothetical protein